MYNGIGIGSVRGTGTSGYVQSNKFFRVASRLEVGTAGKTHDRLHGTFFFPQGVFPAEWEKKEHTLLSDGRAFFQSVFCPRSAFFVFVK